MQHNFWHSKWSQSLKTPDQIFPYNNISGMKFKLYFFIYLKDQAYRSNDKNVSMTCSLLHCAQDASFYFCLNKRWLNVPTSYKIAHLYLDLVSC